MKRYIAMLRGVNVGSRNRISMKSLKAGFEGQGFLDVITYVQSGNVVFNSNSKVTSDLVVVIQNLIKKQYGYDIVVIVKTGDEMKKIVKHNPLTKPPTLDTAKLHVTFLNSMPTPDLIKNINGINSSNDDWAISGLNIYLYCPDGYGRTKLTNTFFEQKLGVDATTRNWKTVTTLADIALK